MKKWILAGIALLLVVWIGAAAAEETVDLEALARGYVPEGAVYLNLEKDDGKYELKFWDNGAQEVYEVEISADGMQVLKVKADALNDRGGSQVALTEAEAKARIEEIYVGAAVESVRLEKDDGLYEYRVAFQWRDCYGVVDIHPQTGAVLERELDYARDRAAAEILPGVQAQVTAQTADAAAAQSTDEARARVLVLERLGGGEILSIRTDWDDGRKVYEGEASDGEYVYDFELDVQTDAFREWERERRVVKPQATSGKSGMSSSTDNTLIGTSRAKQIALDRAGGGRVASIRLEKDDGRQVYDGKVINGNYEYEFEIDALTGSIRDWDAERLDNDDWDDDDDDWDDD